MLSNATTRRQEMTQNTGGHLGDAMLRTALRGTASPRQVLGGSPRRAFRAAALVLVVALPSVLGGCAQGIEYETLRDRNGNITGVAVSPTAPVWVTGRPGHQVINAAPYNPYNNVYPTYGNPSYGSPYGYSGNCGYDAFARVTRCY